MSAWDFACVACDAGSSVAAAAVFIGIAVEPTKRWSAGMLALIFLLGFVSCSVEGRVCEVAERQDVHP